MATKQGPYLSKSAYLSGLQCQKLLWYQFNDKGQFPPIDASSQAVFDQGHEVGELAKQLFQGGVEVAKDQFSADQVIQLTAEAVQHRVPLFEAGFTFQGAYARVDILNPVGKDAWDLIEVKSTTEVKPEHLPDLALQKFVCTGAGLKIRRCHILHINSNYVRQGPVDPRQLLIQEDVTDQLREAELAVPRDLQKMFQTIQLEAHPPIKVGRHCDSPYVCPLRDMCWAYMPGGHIFTLSRGGKKSARLFEAGVLTVKSIPAIEKLSDNQAIQRRAAITGQPHVDKAAIASFLGKLHYPISFLDFESINPAIPLFDDTSPYEQIVFQFSLHLARTETAALEHHHYLADGPFDPRKEFMERLVAALPATGSIVTYNSAFEKGRLEECAELLPQYGPWWKKVKPRILDLWDPFRSFNYYHPDQEGSGSIKAVLPALTGKGYDHLVIQEGGAASREFLRVTFGNVSTAEWSNVRSQLELYCGQDTQALAWIVDSLRQLVYTN